MNERYERCEQTNERMKIEKPGVGQPLLGPAKITFRKSTVPVVSGELT